MRLLELYLKSFGAFTERRIELPDLDGPGLCILYGANEAGKSTALRAIRGLLYGIPSRSPDDFVHRYADLRIGARMRFGDGEELAVMRRKKQKASLYTYDDSAVLESSRLDQLAEEVPEPLFERFYGLDHRSLSEGSEALLADDGDVGRALFGASLGLANLGGVLERLETEASELFAPRASTRRINAAVATWSEVRKEIKSLALEPRQWEAQEKVVRAGEEHLDVLTRRIEEARTESARLERVRRALPALAKRRAAKERLAELVDVCVLPEDFERRLADARVAREAAREVQRRAEIKIEREAAALEGLALMPGLIGERERIESIHQQVEGATNAVEQLPRRETELARLDREIEELLGGATDLGSERIASLREAVGRAGVIRTLASEAAKFEDRVASAQEEVADARAEHVRCTTGDSDQGVGSATERYAEPEADGLQLSLRRAVKLGPIDERIREETQTLAALERDVRQRSRRLGFEAEQLERVEETAFPAHDLIDSIAQRFADHATRRESLREEGRKLRGERARIDEELSVIHAHGVVPKPEELDSLRGLRNHSWREVRRAYVESTERSDPEQGRTLADRFERESSDADGLVDRLRSDAKRVAEQGSLEARGARIDGDLSEVADREERLESDGEAQQQKWLALWAATGAETQAPEVMRGWRRELDELLGLLAQQREADEIATRDQSARSEAIASIQMALPLVLRKQSTGSGGEELDLWIAEAEAVVERCAEAASAYRIRGEAIERATDRVARAERQLEQAFLALEKWTLDWRESIAALDMKDGSRPEEALARIEAMQTLLERLRERDQLADRVEKMRRDVAAFGTSVSELVAGCAPELVDYPPALAISRLHRLLGDSLNQQVLRDKTAEALAEAQDEREEAESRTQASVQVLDGLCELAAVTTEGGLDEALLRWRWVEEATRSLRDAESELANLAEGRSLVELEAQSADADPDVLAARIETLGEETRSLVDEQAGEISELRSQRDLLDNMDGSGRVADLAATAESQLAGIKSDVERFVQLSMARQILEREIKQYRKDNQAPLLNRAGEIFGALTCGAYPSMASQMREDGTKFHLVAVTEAGAEISLEALSAGTRDQLFLSLRLASLEESLARGEPMPLIADDILIEFDDERTRATLEVFAEVGQKTQIFLFSHHRHVAEIARTLGSKAIVVDL